MTYKFLSRQLYSVADEAKRFFRGQWGISESKVQIEHPLLPNMTFVTTLSAVARDNHWNCIEVSERAYPESLDAFVLDCRNRFLPVRLYVAIPTGPSNSLFRSDFGRARENGVGLLEISDGKVAIMQEALSLSLTGIRISDPREFPSKYRHIVSEAASTFKNGNPSKACSVVYDELEGLSRRIAKKAQQKGYWTPANQQPPNFRAETESWAKIMKTLIGAFDSSRSNCPDLSASLFGRVLGVTSHRNDSAHKPKTLQQLMKRDRELRTRFESVMDLLKDLIHASSRLRV